MIVEGTGLLLIILFVALAAGATGFIIGKVNANDTSEEEITTVDVKIAVAVGPDGTYNAQGWGKSGAKNTVDDEDMMNLALDVMPADCALYWVTATLNAPKPETVSGNSEPASAPE